LVSIYDRLLLFCIQVVHPYTINGGENPFFMVSYLSGSAMNETLNRRDRARILQDGQVRLIEAWVRASMDELQEKVSKGAMPSEIIRLQQQLRSGIFDFFGAMRSEGLEARILRYLQEEGCNMDVVNGIQ